MGDDNLYIPGAAYVIEERWDVYYKGLNKLPDKRQRMIDRRQKMYINDCVISGQRIQIVIVVVIDRKRNPGVAQIVTVWGHSGEMPDLWEWRENGQTLALPASLS